MVTTTSKKINIMNARNPMAITMKDKKINDLITQAKTGEMGLDKLFTAAEELQQASDINGALSLYETWVTHTQNPNKHMALFNYGSLLQSTGNSNGAEVAYRKCLELSAKFPQAYINLGLILEKNGNREKALETWSQFVGMRMLKESPSEEMIILGLNHIGRVQEDLKQYELAEKALEQSLLLNPKQSGVIQHWVHIRQKACKWPVYMELPNITQHDMLMATSPLAMLALTDDPVQQLLTSYAFVERTYGFKQEYLCKGKEYKHKRIRLGYVSGDLCTHAVGLLLSEFLEDHDKSKIELYGYDFSPEDGTAVRARLKKVFDNNLRSIHSLNDRQVAELILIDEIDILIDLHGLSSGARPGIFALHPAPKQGTYIGFIGTTGMPWFDFVIADKYVINEELIKYFTEKPIYIEGSFIPITREISDFLVVKRSDFGLPENGFIMAAFGNVYKITEEMFKIWMEIIKQIPNATLWLIDDNPTTTYNLISHIKKEGVDLSRVIFTKRSTHSEYRAKLKLADVFLDTFPYNCGSTTNDVISAGVPIVTISGQTMVSRMGGSILTELGLTSLISCDFNEYMQKVINIANNQIKIDFSKNSEKLIKNKINYKILKNILNK